MKNIKFIILILLTTSIAWSQVSFTGSYNQDFNTLAISGTSDVLPTGWALYETGSNANTTYRAGTGSDNTGDTYSFGLSGNNERAFGGLQSSSLVPYIGANFVNNTGSTITSLNISYTGELWRCGATNRLDSIKFQLSTDATGLNNGNWAYYPSLYFITPSDTFSTGAKIGKTSITP